MTTLASQKLVLIFATTVILMPSARADESQRDALTYGSNLHATVVYEVQVKLGKANTEEYAGKLNYTIVPQIAPQVAPQAEEKRWQTTGNLSLKSGNRNFDPRRGFALGFGSNSMLDPISNVFANFALSELGEIQSQSKEHQLHLLLGDYTTWPFWPLPKDSSKTWTQSDAVMIQQSSNNSRFRYFHPAPSYSPFENRSLSAGTETTTYQIGKVDGPTTEVRQTYHLVANKSEPPITISGSGVGQFDRKRGLFTELNWTRDVLIEAEGAEVRVPVSVSIKLVEDLGFLPMTPEQKKEMEARKAELAEKTRKLNLETQKRMAEQKSEREAKAKAPFTDLERTEWIESLNGGSDYSQGMKVLSDLRERSDRNDPELARALIEFGNKLDNSSLAQMFWEIAAKFDEGFKTVVEMRCAYGRSFGALPATGDPVAASTKLQKGQLIAVKDRSGRNYEARLFVSNSDDGSVLHRRIELDQIEQSPLSDVRYPAPQLMPYLSAQLRGEVSAAQPLANSTSSEMDPNTTNPPMHTWTDKSGKYSIEGKFLSLSDGKVKLQRSDGETIQIAIDQLKAEDAQRAQSFAEAADNPFQVVKP